MSRFFFLKICLLLPFLGTGQSRELDSLKRVLPNQTGLEKINTLLGISYKSFDYSIEDAHQYAQLALAEAQKNKYRPGEKHALTLIGEYYYNLSDSPKAFEYLKKSDKISLQEGGKLYTGYNYVIWANIYLEQSNNDSARICFERALSLLENEENYKIKYYANFCYSSFLFEQNKIEESRKILETLYAMAVKNNEIENQAELLIEFGVIENKKDNYEKAKEYILKAKQLMPQAGYSYVKLIYFFRLGETEYNIGNNFAAIAYLKEVLSTKEIEQYEDIKGQVIVLTGKIYLERGELGLALKSYLEAVKIFERLNMRKDLGRAYGRIAWLYYKQFNDPETIRFANMALSIGIEIQDDNGIAYAHSVLGSLYTAQKKYTQAIQEHERALSIRSRLNARSDISDSYYNLGTAYENSGQIEMAIAYAKKALEIDKSLGSIPNLGMSYKKIASLLLRIGDYSQAKKALEQANAYANLSSSPELRRDVALLFAEFYEKTGDFKRANDYLRRSIACNDSLYNITSLEKMAEIRALFDLENMELENKQRDQAIEIQRIEMESQRNYNAMVVIILILVSFLLVVGAFLYHSSRKNNAKLRAEIADRKKAEAQMIKSQLMLEEAQSIAQVGSWEYNIKTSQLHWSNETYRIFELEGHPDAGLYEAWRDRCHIQDLPILERGIQNTLETGEPFNVEHRVVCSDGSIKYIDCIGEAIKDDNGQIVGLRGTDQDITLQKQAALAKSAFLSSMSHEIRTPINGVIGTINLLMAEHLSPVQREYVNTLQFSAQHLSSIVSDILDLSKIESGNLVFEQSPFDLKAICNNIFKLFESSAKEKQLRFEYIPDSSIDGLLLGDYVRLSQVLSNLLSNAIKFTISGSVQLAYTLKKSTMHEVWVAFIVKDTGIGIDPKYFDVIFDQFSQADKSIHRKYGGTGLGLAISKRLVELQGGTIAVESTEGQGAAFTVELMFAKVPNDKPKAPEEPAPFDTSHLKGLKILVAEDNDVNALVLTAFLKRWGIDYVVAKDGQEAINHVQMENFDAIIMDIQMPNLDGEAATQWIRNMQDEQKRQVPIIAFTADAAIESQQEFLKVGFDDCITKPFQPEHLYNMLKKRLIVDHPLV